MVWFTKREIAYYIILRHVFRDGTFNLGEAITVLSLFGSKRTARKVIKLLLSRGLIEKVGDLVYRIKDLEPALANNLRNYIIQRMYRRLRSVGLDVSLKDEIIKPKVVIRNCNDNLKTVLSSLDKVVEFECL
uniref:Uncharacterized protein n=1 Tax=Ignisphaera aggregans TaxID=334771 RepID=A0A7C2VGD4_9CREN